MDLQLLRYDSLNHHASPSYPVTGAFLVLAHDAQSVMNNEWKFKPDDLAASLHRNSLTLVEDGNVLRVEDL